MTDLTPATTPTVFGLDVTSSGVSIAKIIGSGVPLCKRIPAPSPFGASHAVASTLHRQQVMTRSVLDTVLRDGVRPHLVVMGKLGWALMPQDPSAPRRFGQWWSIAAALTEHKVPVAEVPFSSAAAWAMGKGAGTTTDGLAAVRADLIGRWSELEAAFSKDGAGEKFRPSAVLYAAFGAMALGLETPYPATNDRVKALTLRNAWRGGKQTPADAVRNNSVQFPAAIRPVPRSKTGWDARAKRLSEMGAAVAEPDAVTATVKDTDEDTDEVA